MGVAIAGAGFHEDAASGAQVIDGGLRFDSDKLQRLEKTFGTPTDNDLFTWSFWIKLGGPTTGSSDYRVLVEAYTGSNDQYNSIAIQNGKITFNQDEGSGGTMNETTSAVFRDPNSWYNIVIAVDVSNSTVSNKLKIYVNGNDQSYTPANTISSEIPYLNKASTAHRISARWSLASSGCFDGLMSQVYLIDGQALTPSSFGYTDPLTNTWRPKKYTGTYGNNGFYLPMDGNSPIGQDQSGRGNNWTPVNFGGSNTIEKATGALPILNTDGGGKVARVGVRTDSSASSLVLALPLVGISSDFSNAINSGTSNKAITVSGATATSSFSNFYGGSYDFDGTNDALTFTISGGLGSGDFTIEYWVYQDTLTDYQTHFSSTRGSTGFNVGTDGSGDFVWYSNSARQIEIIGAITTERWYHWAFVRNGSTITGYLDGVAKASFSSSVDYSASAFSLGALDGSGEWTNGKFQDLRVYKGLAKYTQNFIPASTDPDILPDTPSGVAYSSNVALVPSTDGAVAFDGSGDYLQLAYNSDFDLGNSDFTIEAFARTTDTATNYPSIIGRWQGAGAACWDFRPQSTDANDNFFFIYNDGSSNINIDSGAFVCDGGWHHLAVTRSGSNLYMFVDGILRKTHNIGSTTIFNNVSVPLYIGYDPYGSSYYNGFTSNLHLIKGTALYTSNFTPPTAPITSVANTKLLCCKSNSSATAFDVSPGTITANGNATATNFNPFTVNINTQRGQESGYATFNPLDANSSGTLSNGNLQWASAANAHYSVRSSFSMKTGKWYAEGTVLVNTNSVGSAFGIALRTASLSSYTGDTGSWSYHSNGNKYLNGGSGSSFGIAYGATVGNVVGLAFDADNGNLDAYCNGVYQGRVVSGLSSDDYFWMVNAYNWTWGINFGQKPFKFPPPAGFQPLALANTPRPTVVRPDQYFKVSTYTGNGGPQRIIVGNKPDLVWVKRRNSGDRNVITDSVRGVGLTLNSDDARSEGSATESQQIISLNDDGFTVGTNSNVSASGGTFVSWTWKSGGGTGAGGEYWIDGIKYASAAAAGLTGGSLTLTGASINRKFGFSIIGYQGSDSGSPNTLVHGLSKAPDLWIIKNRTNASPQGWVWNTTVIDGSVDYLFLNTTNNKADQGSPWSTLPTSSVITLGQDDGNTCDAGANYIAYCWHNVPGVQKFGVYSGNNSANGPFIDLGFKPALFMHKDMTTGGTNRNWLVWDKERNTYNPMGTIGFWNLSSGDSTDSSSTGHIIDFVSNGVKIRNNNTNINPSSTNFIYAAWAETPSFNLYGGQANAR